VSPHASDLVRRTFTVRKVRKVLEDFKGLLQKVLDQNQRNRLLKWLQFIAQDGWSMGNHLSTTFVALEGVNFAAIEENFEALYVNERVQLGVLLSGPDTLGTVGASSHDGDSTRATVSTLSASTNNREAFVLNLEGFFHRPGEFTEGSSTVTGDDDVDTAAALCDDEKTSDY
jgi:hypothetical protein